MAMGALKSGMDALGIEYDSLYYITSAVPSQAIIFRNLEYSPQLLKVYRKLRRGDLSWMDTMPWPENDPRR